MDIKISFDGMYQVKDATKVHDIKILMLKGEKGDSGGGGGGDENEFVATYDSTTLADVQSAYTQGKTIFCQIGAKKVPLTHTVGSGTPVEYWFAFPHSANGITLIRLKSGGWTESNTSLVPYSRTVNGKALSADITLSASDVGAISAPSSPATGAFLVWNGSAWVAQTLSTWQGGNY